MILLVVLIVIANIMQVFETLDDFTDLFLMLYIIFIDDCFVSTSFILAMQSGLTIENSKEIMEDIDSLVMKIYHVHHMIQNQISNLVVGVLVL
jgi:hypothetical protein